MTHSKSLPRSAPEAQGIPSSAIAAFVKAAEGIHDLHSFMLVRHGTVVAEGWRQPYRAERRHMLFSLSKSFTSTAVGLAVTEGRLSVDDPVLKIFPEAAPRKVSPNLAAMQVRHLLSMSTGHDQDTTDRMIRTRNPVKAFLTLEVEHVPGTHFVYNSGASYVLAAIVQKLTGQTLVEYLSPRLFEPLGIEGAWWESHPISGVNFGGWGLNVKTEDIARFGQLYLQNGMWEGKQLIPTAWVREATSKQVNNAPNFSVDWEQGYGYQFWRCQHNCYRGDGAFGQYCIVMPDQDAVLAITGGLPDMQLPLTAVWEHLLPAMQPAPLPTDEASATQLTKTLQNLALNPPAAGTIPATAHFSGKTYTFGKNDEKLGTLSFDFTAQTLTYRLLSGGARRGTHTLPFGSGSWIESVTPLSFPAPTPVAASGSWTADDTFVLTLCFFETPFMATFTCHFTGDELQLDIKDNVSFGPTERPRMTGKLKK